MRHLEVRQVLTAEGPQRIRGGRRAWPEHDECMRRLAPFLVRHADDGHFLNCLVTQQRGLDLHR